MLLPTHMAFLTERYACLELIYRHQASPPTLDITSIKNLLVSSRQLSLSMVISKHDVSNL